MVRIGSVLEVGMEKACIMIVRRLRDRFALPRGRLKKKGKKIERFFGRFPDFRRGN